ncbi:hypothetical protein Glove_440g8 [Diversispora epigaea]|uniref:TLDc domain-containing protein n=1 Tax=Diversispora epigaea TaxID=1348612 RepID=A0A397GTN0_9GLOM|nr:hypothetical protein Glove_440g8 [Diversispora epigaea]
METKDSFIFSLKNGNIKNSILSRVKTKCFALVYGSQKIHGPFFGNWEFSLMSNVNDFTKDKLCWCVYGSKYSYSYEKCIRTTDERFSIVDYEVFKIVKK